MCLAIPMQITTIHGFEAQCEARGVQRQVSLFMLQDALPREGDFVMVQTGYAVRVVEEADALASWALFDQILDELNTPSP